MKEYHSHEEELLESCVKHWTIPWYRPREESALVSKGANNGGKIDSKRGGKQRRHAKPKSPIQSKRDDASRMAHKFRNFYAS